MTGPRLFHRFVCRVAGQPARLAAELRGERSAALLEEAFQLEERLEEHRELLSERLHQHVAGAADGERRRRLIELRRSLYNLRPVRTAELELLPEDLRREAEALLALRGEREARLAGFAAAFARETEASRRRLREALDDEDFQRALLLSSRALFQAQARYRAAHAGMLRARERQIERGLLRYATRMAMKATPFATFCAVLPGILVDGDGQAPGLRFAGDPLAKRGHVRLNKAFYAVLCGHLTQDPEVRRHFFVRLNPTLVREGEETLVFLTAVRGREVFQRLRTNPAVELIAGILSTGGAPPTLGGLLRELEERPEIEAPAEALEAYAGRLLEIGFLRLSTGIPAQELDWDLSLGRLLAGIDSGRARRAAGLLEELRRLAGLFASASLSERAGLLDRLEAAFEAWRTAEEVPLRVRNPVFEDATAEATALLPRSPGLAALERDLAELVELTSRITLLRRDRATMRHFFDTRYGGAGEVPLLRFYEDYYREHYKAHLEREARERRREPQDPGDPYDLANPFGLDRVARILEARRKLALRIAERWAAGGDVDLTSADLAEIVRDVEPLPAPAGWSVTFYGELIPPAAPDGELRLAVRRGFYVAGFGKMFSRFLYLFPESFAEEVRENNLGLTGETLAELCDDASFNANLHPPLLPAEIGSALGESRGRGIEILPADLVVVRDPRDAGSLALRHARTGHTVLPVDTGFMNPDARPPLFRLLSSFTPGPSFSMLLPEMRAAEPQESPAVTVRPRITCNGRIVLWRRSWQVPGPVYPRPGERESEADYFARLARWRRRHGIPDEIYVTFEATGSPAEPADLEARKPQHIDFRSPLLAGLFGHGAPEHDKFLAILEERLPGSTELARSGGEDLVTELVLQLDCAQAVS